MIFCSWRSRSWWAWAVGTMLKREEPLLSYRTSFPVPSLRPGDLPSESLLALGSFPLPWVRSGWNFCPSETERDETDLSDGPRKTDQHTVPYWNWALVHALSGIESLGSSSYIGMFCQLLHINNKKVNKQAVIIVLLQKIGFGLSYLFFILKQFSNTCFEEMINI